MSTAPTPAKAPKPLPQDKFSVDKAVIGGITLLTMHGTLNDQFEGRKLADSVKTSKVLVDMRDIRRFASWGMSEWMDFLRITADFDLYLVECSTYAVSQINLVTGLLGRAKLLSFYASYRCASCNQELESLFVIPRDRETIRALPGSYQDCVTCGGRARLEEYPAAFFETIADREPFDIDDEVLALCRSKFKYDLAQDLTRFRAYRGISGDYTYLRLSGSMATLPTDVLAASSGPTTVVDLKNVVFDAEGAERWRAYMHAARPIAKSIQLLDCPIGFLEYAVMPEDLHDNVKVRTFGLAYDCLRCETQTIQMIDVAENLEELVSGTAPSRNCPTCKSLLVAVLTHDQSVRLRSLPARDRDPALDKFLAKVRTEPVDKLERCLVMPARKDAAPPSTGRGMLYLGAGLGTVLLGGIAVVGWGLWKQQKEPPPVVVSPNPTIPTQPAKPTFTRPDWIMSDVPASAYCHDVINRLMCVGVSSYRSNRDDGVAEAGDAALEELVNVIGLKISDPFFLEYVMPGYSDVRAKAMLALQEADIDRASPAYAKANEAVRIARKRVVEILHLSGGAAVPTQRSDWYWEEYAGEKGKKNENLVFVRYDISLESQRALVERYATLTTVQGSTLLTAFPGLAWQHPTFNGGAMVVKPAKPLVAAGVAARKVIEAIGDQKLGDAPVLAKQLQESPKGHPVKLTVTDGDTPAKVVSLPR